MAFSNVQHLLQIGRRSAASSQTLRASQPTSKGFTFAFGRASPAVENYSSSNRKGFQVAIALGWAGSADSDMIPQIMTPNFEESESDYHSGWISP
jgi:hypothetical protein